MSCRSSPHYPSWERGGVSFQNPGRLGRSWGGHFSHCHVSHGQDHLQPWPLAEAGKERLLPGVRSVWHRVFPLPGIAVASRQGLEYSGTSNSGHSEKRTTSKQRTSCYPVIEQPLYKGQRPKILRGSTVPCLYLSVCLQFNGKIDFPSDAQRIEKVKLLVDNGHVKQVVLSHDIHTKHRLVRPSPLLSPLLSMSACPSR